MRKTNPADSLFTSTKQDILAATYGQPERWWYLSELAAYAGKTPSSLQRDLKSLAESGILRTRKDRSRSYFRAETNSPLFEPLRSLVERTLGVVENLKISVKTVSHGLDVVFVYGSFARGEENSQSDVDLIVIGNIGQADLARVLRPLESRFGRDFNAKCYKPDEFQLKLKNGNHFVSSVMKGAKVFIAGDENDLERFSVERVGSAAHNQSKRARRSTGLDRTRHKRRSD